jgi:hypothetical protein
MTKFVKIDPEDFKKQGMMDAAHVMVLVNHPKDFIENFDDRIAYGFKISYLKSAIKLVEGIMKELDKGKKEDLILWIFRTEDNKDFPCLIKPIIKDNIGVFVAPFLNE